MTATPTDPVTAEEALRLLREGNARFADGRPEHPHESLDRRAALCESQHPFAVVLGCADSRVPPELVLDEGLGDLFVVRSAGEVLDDAVVASIDYAVAHLGVRLVVVLGHASCGAVVATRQAVLDDATVTGSVATLVRAIEPAVRATSDPDAPDHLARCVAEHAGRTARALVERSEVVAAAVGDGAQVVAATYDLADGRVAWL